jgi:hypothetical protein
MDCPVIQQLLKTLAFYRRKPTFSIVQAEIVGFTPAVFKHKAV